MKREDLESGEWYSVIIVGVHMRRGKLARQLANADSRSNAGVEGWLLFCGDEDIVWHKSR